MIWLLAEMRFRVTAFSQLPKVDNIILKEMSVFVRMGTKLLLPME